MFRGTLIRSSPGCGAVTRDYEGCVMEVKTGCCLGLVEPEIAEVKGVSKALSWVKA